MSQFRQARADLQLRVTSDSNPAEIDQLSNLFTLTQGAPAPLGENKVQFRIGESFPGDVDPATGRCQRYRGHLRLNRLRIVIRVLM